MPEHKKQNCFWMVRQEKAKTTLTCTVAPDTHYLHAATFWCPDTATLAWCKHSNRFKEIINLCGQQQPTCLDPSCLWGEIAFSM